MNEALRRFFRPRVETLEDRLLLTSATSDNDVPAEDAADLVVSMTRSPDPVAAGERIHYAITISNVGAAAAENVRLTDVLPANTTFVGSHQFSGPTFSVLTSPAHGRTGTLVATTPRLLSGEFAVFRLTVSSSPDMPSGTGISNSVSVSTSTADSNLENNSYTDAIDVVTRSDLRVSVIDPFHPVPAGTDVVFRIEVRNLGPSDAQNVTLTNVIPANTTFVSVTQDFHPPHFTLTTPPAGGTGTVSASIATLASNSSRTLTLVVNVNSSVDDGTVISNSPTVSSTTADEDLSNNRDTATTTAVLTSELRLTKSASVDAAAGASRPIDTESVIIISPPIIFPRDHVFLKAGDNFTYTITVTNDGPIDAHDVQLSDPLPAGTTFVSFNAPIGWTSTTPLAGGTGTVTSTIPTLEVGATASFTLAVKIDDVPLGTVIENRANVTTTTREIFTSDNGDSQTASVVTMADLSVVTNGVPHRVAPGSTLTYTITVANAGDSDAMDVILENNVPIYTSLVSLTAPSGWTATTSFSGSGSFIATKPILIAGATETFTLVLQVKPDTLGNANGGIDTVTTIRALHNMDPRPENDFAFEDVEVINVFNVGDAPNTARVLDDPFRPGQSLLLVTSTAGNDRLVIAHGTRNRILVKNRGRLLGIFDNAAFQGIIALGLGGNDMIVIDSRIGKTAELHGNGGADQLFGGAGNDSLFGGSGNDSLFGNRGHDRLEGGEGNDIIIGGSGHDLMLGWAGNDKLYGQTGRDILIGGTGNDYLHGGADDDILIGGTTDHDCNAAALLAIMAEWTSNAPAATRIFLLSGLQSGGANGQFLLTAGGNVHADFSADKLFGDIGNDWFLRSMSDADLVLDRSLLLDRQHRL